MSNTGIFITKDGVTAPLGTEISLSNWQAYQNDLVLPLIKNTNHVFNVFEAFSYRAIVTNADSAVVNLLFNNKTNYFPFVSPGSASLNTSNGDLTITTQPAQIEELGKVFLSGSNVKIIQATEDQALSLRIASIDGASRILFDFVAGVITFTKNNVVTDTDSSGNTIAFTDQVEIFVDDDSIDVKIVGGATLYSHARTYQAKVTAGAIGVLTSSGTTTGSARPFNLTETLDSADSILSGTMTIESAFGQLTSYNVVLGTLIVNEAGLGSPVDLDFLAGNAESHATTDDFSGGVGTITYSVESGNLPAGMGLTSGGVISGVPVTDGDSHLVVKIIDQMGQIEFLEYNIHVASSANVNYSPPPGIQNVPYNYNPAILGIFSAELLSGVLPTGLSLNTSNGAITGTPTATGGFEAEVKLSLGASGPTEDIDFKIHVYPQMQAEFFKNGDTQGFVVSGQSKDASQNDVTHLEVSGGSGNYQYSITGDNHIDSDGNIRLFSTDAAKVTVVDTVTGQTIIFSISVAGQGDICGMAVVMEGEENQTSGPCTDVITDCTSPVQIAFNSMAILKGVEVGETPFREYPSFDTVEGAIVQNNGKAFSLFRSTVPNGFAIANNAKDGRGFILEFALSASVANGADDMAVGIAKLFNGLLTDLDFALVITTVSTVRSVELRKDNVYQNGSRFPILEGQQIGFGVFPDAIYLYVDGILKFTLTSKTFSCSGVDLVFLALDKNYVMGGAATNLVYDIDTVGSADEVGTIDSVTGLYTPSANNLGLIRVSATSTANSSIKYNAKVRVVRPAVKTSLEHAMIEGIPVEMWIADMTRFDDEPLRLDREGNPDKNQVSNPEHLGTLVGSGKIDVTATRQDFRNDRGATSTSLVFDKATISGAYLAVRNFDIVKRLVPFMREFNSHGVRQLKQYSTGCQKKMKVFLIWQTPDCEDVPVFDAIEVHNGLSYTPFSLEIGKAVQSNIPITIEGFPNKDGVIFDYNQYDKHFNRIGA